MPKFTVQIKLPAIACDFHASYSHVDRFSGIQYMILTIVNTDSFRGMTWRKIMDIFGIPAIIYDMMYRPAINQMVLLKMIEPIGEFDLDDYVGNMITTRMGKQAYERGVMAQDVKDFSGTVAYVPARLDNKYVKESSVKYCNKEGFHEDRFSDLEPDEYRIENHIIKEKTEYGVDETDTDIFDIRIEKHDSVNCYFGRVYMNLNEATGHFTVDYGGLDDNFLKGRFTSAELISKIPAWVFQPSSIEITFDDWTDNIPNWDNVGFVLPCDVRFDGSKLVLVNGKNCGSEKYPRSEILDEADLVVIETSNIGYEYVLIEIPVSAEGFEGESRCRMAVRRMIDVNRIAEYVGDAARSINAIDSESLAKALDLCNIIFDKDLSKEIVNNCLHNTADFQGILIELKQYRKLKWFDDLSDMVEEVIIEKEYDAKSIAAMLDVAGLQIAGTLVASRFRTDDSEIALANADVLTPIVKDAVALLRNMNLEQIMTDRILSGDATEYSSKYLSSMSNLSRNLCELKKTFGIRSPSNYAFDITETKNMDLDHLRSCLSTFEKDLDTVNPIIQGTEGYAELKAYESFFKEMKLFITDNGTDLRTSGIEEGIRLSEYLEKLGLKGTLDEMITEARDRGIISDSKYSTLNEFRLFRNECAHRMIVGEVKKDKLKKWKQAIDDLSCEKSREERKR